MIYPKPFATDILDSGALGRSLVQQTTAIAAGLTIPFATDNTSNEPYEEYIPDRSVDASNPTFRRLQRSFLFGDTYDVSYYEGYNVLPGGSFEDNTKPLLFTFHEYNFKANHASNPAPGSEILVCEWHLGFQSPASYGVSQQRPISFYGQFNTASRTTTNNTLAFRVQNVYHSDHDGSNFYWQSDVGGFRLTNVPLSLTHTDTSINGVVVNLPASSTGKFLSMTKNSGEFCSMSRFGEFYLDGRSTGSGTGIVNAMLEVYGRTGTSDVCRFSSNDGNVRLRVAEGTGSYTAIRTAGAFGHSGPLSVYDTNGTTERFRCDELGGLRFSGLTSATGPVGNIVAKLPASNIAASLSGFIAIYDAIT